MRFATFYATSKNISVVYETDISRFFFKLLVNNYFYKNKNFLKVRINNIHTLFIHIIHIL